MTHQNEETTDILGDLAPRTLFMVWGPPSHGPRSKVFARKLGIDAHFIYSTMRRGALIAPYKYAVQALKTIKLLVTKRPRLVFVQSPPSFAVVMAAMYSLVSGAGFLVDAHSDAFQRLYWTRPRWLYRWVAKRALATIVTNEHFADQIQGSGGAALVIRDIPTEFPGNGSFETAPGFSIAVVNTFADDEPLDEILDAASRLPATTFYVTGRLDASAERFVDEAPTNVHFVGFLDDPTYYSLLRKADAVMCLTTRDHTMQRGACEALSLARPIITSDWPLLRGYFRAGTVHVGSDSRSIQAGVGRMQQDHARFLSEIVEQQRLQQHEWAEALGTLRDLLDRGLGGGRR